MSDDLKDVLALVGRIEALCLTIRARAKSRWDIHVLPEVKLDAASTLSTVGDDLAKVFKELGRLP